MLNTLAYAAPSMPYFGINKRLNTKLMIAPANSTFMKISCLPVICNRLPAGPEKALTILAAHKMINTCKPPAKSSPNNDSN